MKTKVCTKCIEPKPLNRFRERTKNGRTWKNGFCTDCEAKNRKRYWEDPEKIKVRQRRYYEKNKAAHNERCKGAYKRESIACSTIYIRKLLRQNGFSNVFIDKNPSLIELKRLQVLQIREIRKHKK